MVTNGFYSLELEVIEGNKTILALRRNFYWHFFAASSLFPMHIFIAFDIFFSHTYSKRTSEHVIYTNF